VAPWFQNTRKRLVKTPKLYFADTGLLCRLLEVGSSQELSRHPQRGAVFENWVLTEILKAWHHRGEEPPVFFWRDTEGHEVDFVIQRGGHLHPVEVKAGRTVQPDFFQGIRYLGQQDETIATGLVVYGGDNRQSRGGMAAVPWQKLSAALDGIRNAG
jgi:predicted AAA+ superfamily ATPase